jgi:CheY-like chemotaxis protein
VLLDIHMRVMDGVTFLNHLRQRPDQADFEVIVMSASLSTRSGSQSCRGHPRDAKPFDIEEIPDLVAEFAERRPVRPSQPSQRHPTVSPAPPLPGH